MSSGDLALRKLSWSVLNNFGQNSGPNDRFFEKIAWIFELDLLE